MHTDTVDMAGLKGMRVLCIRGEGDDAGLDGLLAAARRDLAWTVETVQPEFSAFLERKAFESDPAAVAALDKLISDCELASGVPAGRILLAGEADLGRGFSAPSLGMADNAVARSVLADNTEPFRILRRLFAHAREKFAEVRPGLVLFAGRADPWYFVFQLLARQQGIAALALRRSQLWDERCYWSGEIAALNWAASEIAAAKQAAHAAVSRLAQDYIGRARKLENRRPEDELAGLRYVYVALDEEPGAAPDCQSPFWSNQYYLVEMVCSTLPAGYKLLVRDHPSNFGRRPSQYHRDLSRLPNVVLVDPADEPGRYIAHAALVVTDDSPAGWQALLHGRLVIALADNFFGSAGLARRVRNPEQLAASVVGILAPTLVTADSDPRQPGWLLDAEWETTAPVVGDAAEVLALLARTLRHARAGSVATGATATERRVEALT